MTTSLTTTQTQLPARGEMATAAMAAKAKATIEARYAIAFQPINRRQYDVVRQSILSACKRPDFAASARYHKPVGTGTIDGFSIRFAEEAIKAMKNISVESTTIYEDEMQRVVQINVTDLENNITYGKEISVQKTVERRNLKNGQTAISQRLNSNGETVYLVAATEDEIANKIASAESKVIRNCGLRLVPSDILEEAEQAIFDTMENGGSDPKAEIKKLADAFALLSISAAELVKYLGHPLDTISPKERADLRGIYTTIKEGSASWSDYVTVSDEASVKPSKPVIKKKDPKTVDVKAEPVQEPTSTPTTATTPEPDNAPDPTEVAKPTLPEKVVEFRKIFTASNLDIELFKKQMKDVFGADSAAEAETWKTVDDVPEQYADYVLATSKRIQNMKVLCAKD